jgi:ubiquitin C-terminal hydrolase
MLNVRNSLLVGVHRYDQQSGADKVKLHDKIAFDVELDVAPFMIDSSRKSTIMNDNGGRVPMELKAISCHAGMNLDRGHYFAYAKQMSNQWLRISDKDVEKVDVSQVMSETARVVLLRYDMV